MVSGIRVRRLALPVAGVLLAGSLTGCFDGTVRNPPEGGAHSRSNKSREGHRQRQVSAGGGGGEGAVTIAAVGDTMMGNTPILPPEPATYLDAASGELKGDVVFGNLEGTLTDVSESPKCAGAEPGQCYAFRAPPSYASYLAAAGFTAMSNANNHSFDFGEAGEDETIEALRAAGIQQTGLPDEVTVVKAGGRRVAVLAFAPYSNTASLTDLPTAEALIRRADEEADVVVVAIHAGAEGTDAQHVTGGEETYLGEDRGNAEEFAQMAVRAGADLVLGSGPHVLRGIEVYHRRLIAYSLGNFCGYENFSLEGALGESAVLHVTLAPDGSFRSGRIASMRLVETGRPVPDPEGAAAATIASLSREDFGSSGVGVSGEGRIVAP